MSKAPILDMQRIITASNLPPLDNLKDGAMLLVNKPLDWTSFDVVNKIRSSIKYDVGIKKMKVGHAGTLDPLATGLLLVCVGKYTKLIESLTTHSKDYAAIVKLGATTPSYDSESQEENISPIDHLTNDSITKAVNHYRGDQLQMPPIFSAIKINGQSAHRLARKGKDVELKARPITIFRLECQSIELPLIYLDVSCSKGTYIRSLAHDIGQYLETGGYLKGLIRTKVEDYHVDDSLSLEQVKSWICSLPPQVTDTKQ